MPTRNANDFDEDMVALEQCCWSLRGCQRGSLCLPRSSYESCRLNQINLKGMYGRWNNPILRATEDLCSAPCLVRPLVRLRNWSVDEENPEARLQPYMDPSWNLLPNA